jgi:hypothetical protein
MQLTRFQPPAAAVTGFTHSGSCKRTLGLLSLVVRRGPSIPCVDLSTLVADWILTHDHDLLPLPLGSGLPGLVAVNFLGFLPVSV